MQDCRSGTGLLTGAAALSCQSYSTGLEQVWRVQMKLRAREPCGRLLWPADLRGPNNGNFGTFQQLAAGGLLDSRFNTISRP